MFRNLYVLAPEGAPGAFAPAAAAPAAAAPTTTADAGNTAKTTETKTNAAPTKNDAPAATEKGVKTSEKAPSTRAADDELFEVTVGGKAKKLPLKEVLRLASLSDGAQERFQEAAKMKKEAEGIVARARNPREAIKLLHDPKLGLNPEEIRTAFEDWYQETYIEREKMSPEQRDLADAKARLKEYEDKDKTEQEKKKAAEDQELTAKEMQTIQEETIKTIETSGLPKTRFVAGRVAYWTRLNESKGLNAPRELIVQQVRTDLRRIMDDMVQSSDGDVLVNLLGENTAKKLRAHDLKILRERRAKLGQGTGAIDPNEDPTPAPKREKIRYSEVNRRMKNLRLGRLR